MKFSDRMGITQPRTLVQIKSFDRDTKIQLWNVIYICILKNVYDSSSYSLDKAGECGKVCKLAWIYFFHQPFDNLPNTDEIVSYFKKWFFDPNRNFWEQLNLIEFLVNNVEDNIGEALIDFYNSTFESYLVGYRFIDKILVPLDDKQELEEISTIIKDNPYENVSSHIKKSLDLFADRNNPDYKNSIKESISAVEAMCRMIVGDDSATLGKALSKITEHIEIHPALKDAFSKIYGYTSDAGGIRHAEGLDSIDASQEDARYMLASCSAFINYLTEKYRKAQ